MREKIGAAVEARKDRDEKLGRDGSAERSGSGRCGDGEIANGCRLRDHRIPETAQVRGRGDVTGEGLQRRVAPLNLPRALAGEVRAHLPVPDAGAIPTGERGRGAPEMEVLARPVGLIDVQDLVVLKLFDVAERE